MKLMSLSGMSLGISSAMFSSVFVGQCWLHSVYFTSAHCITVTVLKYIYLQLCCLLIYNNFLPLPEMNECPSYRDDCNLVEAT